MKPVHNVTISVAGFPIRLQIPDRRVAAMVTDRYGGYCNEQSRPALTLTVSITKSLTLGSARVRVGQTAHGWRAQRRDFDARWENGQGTACIGPSIYSIDALLRILLATCLPGRGRVLLHASAVSHGGRAFVFFGVSESGKTTSCRLAGTARILNDEIIAVGTDSRGRARVWATPFWGELRTGPVTLRPVPPAVLCDLHKAERLRSVPLDPLQGVSRLLKCVCLFGKDPLLMQSSFDTLAALAQTVRVVAFHFPKKPFDWAWMERMADE